MFDAFRLALKFYHFEDIIIMKIVTVSMIALSALCRIVGFYAMAFVFSMYLYR